MCVNNSLLSPWFTMKKKRAVKLQIVINNEVSNAPAKRVVGESVFLQLFYGINKSIDNRAVILLQYTERPQYWSRNGGV